MESDYSILGFFVTGAFVAVLVWVVFDSRFDPSLSEGPITGIVSTRV